MKKKLAGLIIILVIFIIYNRKVHSTATTSFNNISDIYQEANSYYFKKDYINAVKFFRKVINDYPASSYTDMALFGLGSCYFELENYRDAITVYSQLVEELPNSNYADDALFRIGESYERLTDYRNSNLYYSKLLNQYPNSLLNAQAREKVNKFTSSMFNEKKADEFGRGKILQPETNNKSENFSNNIPIGESEIESLKNDNSRKVYAAQEKNIQQIEKPAEPQKNRQSAAQIQPPQPGRIQKNKIVEKKYVVRAEDTLTSIAEKFYGDFRQYVNILDYNNYKRPDDINLGQTIIIPVDQSEVNEDLEPTIITNKLSDSIEKLKEESENLKTEDTQKDYLYKHILEKERKNFEQILEVEREKRTKHLERIRELETQIAKLNVEADGYKKNIAALEDFKTKIVEFEKNNQDLLDTLKLQKQKEIISDAKNRTELLKLQQALDELTEKYTVAKKEFESKKYDEMIREREQQIMQASVLINQLNLKVQNLDNENKGFITQLAKMKIELVDIGDLKSKLITTEQQLAVKSSQLTKFESELKKLVIENNVFSDSVSSLTSKYSEAYAQKNRLEKANVEIARALKEKDDDISSLSKQLSSLKVELAALRIEYQTQRDTALIEKKIYEGTIAKLNEELKNLKNSLSSQKDVILAEKQSLELTVVKLNETIKNNDSQISQWKNNYVTLQKENISYKEQIMNSEKKIADITAQLAKLQESLDSINKNTVSYQDENSALRKNVTDYKTKIASLEAEIVAKGKGVDSYKEQYSSAENKANELNSKLAKMQSTIDNLTKNINAYQQENEGLKKDLQSFQTKVASLETEITAKNSQMDKMRETSQKSEAEAIKSLKTINESLSSQLTGLQKEISSIQDKYKSTQQHKSAAEEREKEQKKVAQNKDIIKKDLEIKQAAKEPVKEKESVKETEKISIQQDRPAKDTAPDKKTAETKIESSASKDQQSKIPVAAIYVKAQSEENIKSAKEYIGKGIIYKNRGEFDKAEDCYKKAIELDPENADGYNHLGFLYCENGKELDVAVNLVNKAIQLNSNDRGYYYDTLGWIYFQQGALDKSMKYIKESIDMIPTEDKVARATVYYHLGMIYVKMSDPNNAFFQFIETLKLAPNTSVASKARQQLELL